MALTRHPRLHREATPQFHARATDWFRSKFGVAPTDLMVELHRRGKHHIVFEWAGQKCFSPVAHVAHETGHTGPTFAA